MAQLCPECHRMVGYRTCRNCGYKFEPTQNRTIRIVGTIVIFAAALWYLGPVVLDLWNERP